MPRLHFLLAALFAPFLVRSGGISEFGVAGAGIPDPTYSRPPHVVPSGKRKYDAEYNTKHKAIMKTYQDAVAACRIAHNTCMKNAGDARDAALKALDESYVPSPSAVPGPGSTLYKYKR